MPVYQLRQAWELILKISIKHTRYTYYDTIAQRKHRVEESIPDIRSRPIADDAAAVVNSGDVAADVDFPHRCNSFRDAARRLE